MTIDIYIQTETKNPAVKKTNKARWMIVAQGQGIETVQRNGQIVVNNATPKAAALIALGTALSRFNKPAVIKLYISDDFVRNMLITNMLSRWERNGWHKIRQNADLRYENQWRDIKKLMSNHAISIASAEELENKYQKEMEWRMTNVG